MSETKIPTWKSRNIHIDIAINNVEAVNLVFQKGCLHLEHWDDKDELNFGNGHSFLFMAPCGVHNTEVCWDEWLWIDEPAEDIFRDNPNEEFGWWMI